MLGRTLMVQGTASSVGKSLLVTALCRIFRQRGVRVAPFKAQNMALNSFVTPDGGEIGRAQAVQAEAAGVVPTVEMNPILLKPEGDARCQVVVLGKAVDDLTAAQYHARTPEFHRVIVDAIERLRERYELVVIEGAGSPAEINLKDRDIANMHIARVADAPVLLVGDIDRGGVFAALVGTLELLDPEERARIAGFVINKFRGDLAQLQPGLDALTERTGVPVLGVIPYVPQLRIADEDSVAIEDRRHRQRASMAELDVAVIRLPRISNHDDFLPLEHEPGVVVRYVERPEEVGGADLVILPGSKSTLADLGWLRQSGMAEVIAARARYHQPVLGVCGGCQMLGRSLSDPEGVESSEPFVLGLDLLPLESRFARQKLTAQVQARSAGHSFLADMPGLDVQGYEIHMGMVGPIDSAEPAFEIVTRNGQTMRAADGAVSCGGALVGTMIHGLFENAAVRASLLRSLRARRGLPQPQSPRTLSSRDDEYDRLAAVVRGCLDAEALLRIAGLTTVPRV